MKMQYATTLAVLAGFGFGCVAVQSLHAQDKAPIYYVAEIATKDPGSLKREYDSKVQDTIRAAGGRILAAGENVATIEGQPVRSGVIIVAWDSMEKIQAWRNSATFKDARKIGNNSAQFRAFTVEGLAP